MPGQHLLPTRAQMLCILEYITNFSNKTLSKTFFLNCDKRIIQFLCEIVLNLLDGIVNVDNRKPFLKFRPQLEAIYSCSSNTSERRHRKGAAGKLTLARQRLVFCSPKGLKLVKLLFNIVRNRQFTR